MFGEGNVLSNMDLCSLFNFILEYTEMFKKNVVYDAPIMRTV